MMAYDKKFIIESLVVGPIGVNCYILGDPGTKEACVIDPGADPDMIRARLAKLKLNARFIVNTHGHGDHIGANTDLDLPIYIHSSDKDFLTDPDENLSSLFLFNVVSPEASRLLADGDDIAVGGLKLKVIHTPGHTPGSIVLVMDKIAFTGDTLFAGSVGRSDLKHSDPGALDRSIEKLKHKLSDDMAIYPGHGPSSTMAKERRTNPFLV